MNQKPAHEHRGKLSISEDGASVFVEGDTFKYGFDKKSGLISCLEVLGDDFLSGTNSQIPDIYVSNARDPRESYYAARYEKEAECDVISASPYEVHIRTHGIYHNDRGEAFPVRYRITYEIHIDGTMFVIVDNKAYERSSIRWLCISRGLLNSSLCKYFSHLADQSRIDTTENYTFKAISEGLPSGQRGKPGDGTLLSGRLIPWFWLGNDETGVEICMWDVTHHRYGATQVAGKMADPLGQVGANVSVSAFPHGVLWEIFSLRNLQTPVEEEWEQISYFALSVTPPKKYNPEFANLRAYWAGSRLYIASYKYLSDDEIADLSRAGYNLIIGGVNWRSGEYIPDNESEAKRVISTCHKYGMKIIPHVSLMDLNEDTEAFEEQGPEWRIEPVVEHEYETHLMCPGAEGWREYWRQQVDRIVEDYGFDGIYLDFWYDKLACRNPRHGCQRRYMRPTFPWVRDMLRYAWAKFKSRDPDSVVVANTDLLPISMICSWLDVRSVGASQDVRHVDRMTGNAFYSSYRLGCNSLMWPSREQKIDRHLISLSLLYMAPILLNRERSKEEIDLTLLYWSVLRFFGVSEARWYPGFLDNPETNLGSSYARSEVAVVKTQAEACYSGNPAGSSVRTNLYVNVHRREEQRAKSKELGAKSKEQEGESYALSPKPYAPCSMPDALLLTLVNLSPNEVRSSISLMNFAELGLRRDKDYLIYEPVSRKFLDGRQRWPCDELKSIDVTIPGQSLRLLYIRECADNPVLLFALGGDRILEEQWDAVSRTLRSQLVAPVGADVSLVVYSQAGKPVHIVSASKETQFTWDEDQKLAFFSTQASDVTTAISVSL